MPTVAAGAQVSDGARLADDVTVGVGAIIEENCEIGSGCEIGHYAIIWSGTVLGKNNRIFPFCSLGGEPQDKKFKGEDSRLVIGDDNTIREYCFFNRGTAGGGGETRIGSRNWLMGYVHAAHDCILGDDIIAANGAQFAGHVTIGNGAVIGGGSLFHQFRQIGALAMVGGGERVRRDIPPFALAARGVVGVNTEGMRRAGFAAEQISAVKEAYRILYLADLPLEESRSKIEQMAKEELEVESALKDSQERRGALQTLAGFLSLDNLELIRPAK